MNKEIFIKIANNKIDVMTYEGYRQTMNDLIILQKGKTLSVGEVTREELKERL